MKSGKKIIKNLAPLLVLASMIGVCILLAIELLEVISNIIIPIGH